MADEPKPTNDSIGAQLAKLRWEKTSEEERREHGKKLADARWGAKRVPKKAKR